MAANFIGKNIFKKLIIGLIFRDPHGDTNYSTDSFDIDPLIYTGDSRARLGRTQEDLQKYKARIDANVEHQKEYSEIMSDMHQKVNLTRVFSDVKFSNILKFEFFNIYSVF